MVETDGCEANQASQSHDIDWYQYVTFAVDERDYGIEITKVREIKGWCEPTELPNSPHAMKGVLNLRGIVVPVFDLRAYFGRGETDASLEHVVIVVALGKQLIGVLVDAVSDILTLDSNKILPLPTINDGADHQFLSGLVSQGERMVALLKLEELFSFVDLPADLHS